MYDYEIFISKYCLQDTISLDISTSKVPFHTHPKRQSLRALSLHQSLTDLCVVTPQGGLVGDMIKSSTILKLKTAFITMTRGQFLHKQNQGHVRF